MLQNTVTPSGKIVPNLSTCKLHPQAVASILGVRSLRQCRHRYQILNGNFTLFSFSSWGPQIFIASFHSSDGSTLVPWLSCMVHGAALLIYSQLNHCLIKSKEISMGTKFVNGKTLHNTSGGKATKARNNTPH